VDPTRVPLRPLNGRKGRSRRTSSSSSGSLYGGAFFVDGFRKARAYIIHPAGDSTGHSTDAFWRMTYDHAVCAVVALNTAEEGEAVSRGTRLDFHDPAKATNFSFALEIARRELPKKALKSLPARSSR